MGLGVRDNLTPAAAVVPPPAPVNVLPSALRAAAPTSSPLGSATTSILYNLTKNNAAGWQILQRMTAAGAATPAAAQAAGAISSSEAATASRILATRAVPLVAGGALGTSAAGASKALTVVSAGVASFQLTTAGLRLMNVLDDGKICSAGDDPLGSLIQMGTGTDCGAFRQAASSVQNSDATTWVGARFIDSQGLVVHVTGQVQWTYKDNQGQPQTAYVWTFENDPSCESVRGSWQKAGASQTLPCAWIKFEQPGGGIPSANGAPWDNNGQPYYLPNNLPAGTIAAQSQDLSTIRCAAPAMATPDQETAFSQCQNGTGPAQITKETGDPARSLYCRVQNKTTGEWSKGVVEVWRQSDPTIPTPACPDIGGAPGRVQITQDTGGDVKQLLDQPVPAEADPYPECSYGACLLMLKQDGAEGTCFDGQDCAGWAKDPNRSEKYRCSYGRHAVSLDECMVYAPRFEAAATKDYLADPTGEPLPNETEQPLMTPAPGSGTDPGDGTTPSPAGDQATDQPACMSELWESGLNPVAWVVVPVKCALSWAFIPTTPQLQAVGGKISTAWDATVPGRVVAAVGAWDLHPTMSGCDGIPLDVPIGSSDGHGSTRFKADLLAACDAPMDVLANVSSITLGMGAVIGSVISITRSVGGVFAFGGLGGGGDGP